MTGIDPITGEKVNKIEATASLGLNFLPVVGKAGKALDILGDTAKLTKAIDATADASRITSTVNRTTSTIKTSKAVVDTSKVIKGAQAGTWVAKSGDIAFDANRTIRSAEKFVKQADGSWKAVAASSKATDKVVETTRVGRWMSPEEYKKMLTSGKVQMSKNNMTHVANPADIDAFKAAKPGSVYVEFDVSKEFLSQGGEDGWGIINFPGSLEDRLRRYKGLDSIDKIPSVSNIDIVGKK